jgi:two-component system response regulator AtoC
VRRVEARIVAATNRDLAELVTGRTFRQDLFYRLNAITVRLPPLRNRRADVSALSQHFLVESARDFGRRFTGLGPATLGLLESYRWPGNVRELRAVISRAVLLHDDVLLMPEHLAPELIEAALSAPTSGTGREADVSGSRIPTLEEVELSYIRRVLAICGGNRTQAAQHLGITRQTLAKKVGGDDAG